MSAFVVAMVAATPSAAHADSVRDQQWHLDALHVTDAHKISQGEGVVVALTDSGVDTSAPELGPAVVPGKDFSSNGTGDGRTDTNGHGTALAGLIAGRGKGGDAGVLGIAPKAAILPLRVSPSPDYGGSPANLAAGFEWAIAHNAKVICVAVGGSSSPELQRALDKALAADIVVVAAAGNLPKAKSVIFPASAPGVLAVGGVDRQGQHATFSTSGPEVALVAPAVDIVSVSLSAGYGKTSGTSDATALVAGAAALVRAKYPQLSAQEVIHRLTYTAHDAGPPGRDADYGYGVLDLVKALTAEVPPASPTAGAKSSATADGSGGSGGGRQVAVIAAISAAAVVVVFIAVLQTILRGRRRRG
ncbi:S8 family serine peptidase [Dactylosporangium sp. CA-139066]|uniref:S8 family serine peptidase n=1 Tax=Dactylosporangium sp. CA-139066 TaxID=3239930 RepID=UPI003D90DE3E